MADQRSLIDGGCTPNRGHTNIGRNGAGTERVVIESLQHINAQAGFTYPAQPLDDLSLFSQVFVEEDSDIGERFFRFRSIDIEAVLSMRHALIDVEVGSHASAA